MPESKNHETENAMTADPITGNTTHAHALGKPAAQFTIREFLQATGDKQPVPGGGTVAAVTGALAAALARMVVSFSVGKKSQAEHSQLHQELDATLTRAADLLLALADEDATAYAEFRRLSSLPEDNPDRAENYPAAALAIATVPLSIAGTASEILAHIEPLAGRSNPWLRSDLAIAAALARTAASAAHHNVAVNIDTLASLGLGDGFREEADKCLEDANDAARRIEEACAKGW